MYKLRREPTQWNDFGWIVFQKTIAIWRDNGTLICNTNITSSLFWAFRFQERSFSFTIYDGYGDGFDFKIYGKTDAAIAETATFFLSLKHNDAKGSRLKIPIPSTDQFDFAAVFQPEQLAHVFDANPGRIYEFVEGTLSPEHSVVLATRSFPLNVKLTWLSLGDNGTAFVNALSKRDQPSFGLFSMTFCYAHLLPMSHDNIERFLNLNITFKKLDLGILYDECALLPFSIRTNALSYEFNLTLLDSSDFEDVNILTNDLDLRINLGDTYDWDEHLVSIFERIAELGHFQKLRFSVHQGFEGYYKVKDTTHIAEALIEAVIDNSDLECLDLGESYRCLDWAFQFKAMFKAMEHHPSLRKFIVDEIVPHEYCPEMEDSDSDDSTSEDSEDGSDVYDWLKQLVSKNPKIVVHDSSGTRCSNGEEIDCVYLLNRMDGYKELVKEPPSSRPLLVATALVESAAETFQNSALLLSNHADILCELLHDANLVKLFVAPEETVTPLAKSVDSKRKLRIQPLRAAKKAARK
ncbi:hypothetical protein FisN_18Lh099 [Fistulifera solaris]|uniref:Uncharacterized protein n=1 Tax=Fistulifera solaris TaxID=1519565 RepID=A0A1Z5KFS8_FISSO|nr:hypothetical protein FisN_18Lh099 [Fistulifera solaris]|eukprot:GAX24818.1 hypothetical protein FisN_18Lh099 [Fistulifera solaris]